MLFWHVGGTVLLFRLLFRDPGVDLRFLVAGALLPDAVDVIAGLLRDTEPFVAGRLYGHSLFFAAAVLAVGMLATDRGSPYRKRAVAAAVGIMFHLLLDAMWLWPEVLLWPLPDGSLPAAAPGDWSLPPDPARLAQEAAGLIYLIWLSARTGLSDPDRRSQLWRTGTV